MDDIKNQIDALTAGWEQVYSSLKDAPDPATPYLNGMNLEQISEVIGMLHKFISRTKPPKGLKPKFHLARAAVLTVLPQANASLASLQKGEYTHFPNFIGRLNQMVSTFFALTQSSDSRDAIQVLSAELSENIALLDTAQTELKKKLDLLQETDEQAENIQSRVAEIEESKNQTNELLNQIKMTLAAASEKLQKITEHETEYASAQEELEKVLEDLKNRQSTLDEQKQALQALHEETKSQSELIRELLPDGASAGLASAFNSRKRQMGHSQLVWMFIFLVAIIGLCTTGFWITGATLHDPQIDLWKAFLQKLPVLAPLVWLGWFSAIQYGNSLRVQEDYAFKEATSKAFQGYRDHMEHLKDVDMPDGAAP